MWPDWLGTETVPDWAKGASSRSARGNQPVALRVPGDLGPVGEDRAGLPEGRPQREVAPFEEGHRRPV